MAGPSRDADMDISDFADGGDEYVESDSSGDNSESDLDAAEMDGEPSSSEYETESDNDDTPSVYNPVWSSHNTIGLRDIPFTRQNRLLVPIPGENRPFDWFMLLLDIVLLENIVQLTNAYAWVVFGMHNLTPKSRINKWRDMTVDELKIFIGLILHMGTVRINRFNDYWKTSRYFNFGFIREQMSRDRFLNILRCLHFSKHDDTRGANDRLHKVRLLIDHFNTKMTCIYYPCRELSLDEGMILWRGRLILRQYIKGKRHRYGIKLYSLCEPGGLCVAFNVYSGKGGDLGGKGHANKVVRRLMFGKLNVGHALYMDNYYNSFALASDLLKEKTYCTGTLRSNRLYTPVDVKNARLQRGEKIERYAEGIMIGKWRDKRQVLYISSEYNNDMAVSTNKRGVRRDKPVPIIYYNARMKGVDRHDQMLSYYPIEHKSLRWYKKVFVHFIQMLMINAFKLHKFANPRSKKSLYQFRLDVLDILLPTKEVPRNLPEQPREVRHVLSKILKRSADGKRIQRRKCQQCSKEGKKNVFSVYFCSQCPNQPALCALRCFEKWHTE